MLRAVSLLLLTTIWAPHANAHTFIYNMADGTPVFRVNFPDGWRLDLDFEPPVKGVDAPPPPGNTSSLWNNTCCPMCR